MKLKIGFFCLAIFLASGCHSKTNIVSKPITVQEVINTEPIKNTSPKPIPTPTVTSTPKTVATEQVEVKLPVVTPEPTQTGPIGIKVNQQIGDQTTQTFSVSDGASALELLKSSHKIKVKNYGSLGDMVIEIDGLAASNQNFWEFFVNNKSSNVGAGSYILKPGDKIDWKLTELK